MILARVIPVVLALLVPSLAFAETPLPSKARPAHATKRAKAKAPKPAKKAKAPKAAKKAPKAIMKKAPKAAKKAPR